MGNSLALVTGLYSAAIRSAHQPAGSAGWIELFHYTLSILIFDIELLAINERHINHNVNCRFSVYREKSLSLQQ